MDAKEGACSVKGRYTYEGHSLPYRDLKEKRRGYKKISKQKEGGPGST